MNSVVSLLPVKFGSEAPMSQYAIYPLVQEISYIQDYDLENGVKVTKNFTCLNSVTTIYPLKSDEYPYICSRNNSF